MYVGRSAILFLHIIFFLNNNNEIKNKKKSPAVDLVPKIRMANTTNTKGFMQKLKSKLSKIETYYIYCINYLANFCRLCEIDLTNFWSNLQC